MKAELLLIDDREGRQEAKRRAIPVTGTLGILDRASERGLIDLPVVVDELRKTNFYLSANAVKSLLDRHSGDRSK
jgi:predicted nucleic acid-binding protein